MISQEKIDKFLRMRSKGMARTAIMNLGKFTSEELAELSRMFPKKSTDTEIDWRGKNYFGDKIHKD